MNPPVTVDALLREGVAALSKSGARDTPALDAGLLLGQVLGVTRARLGSHPELPVAAATAAAFRQLIARRADGEPLAYITGRREFWSLELSVTPDVLVPRPETELLVERALALGARGSAQVADLGTGSGAIALALAHERPQWQLVATDIAPASLAVARSNAAALGTTNVEFRLGSWYEALPVRSFDVVVSNPPYVAAADPALEALRHEPRGALTPGSMPSRHCATSRAVRRRTSRREAGWCWSTAPVRANSYARNLSSPAFVTYARTAIWPDTSVRRKDNDDQI